MRTAFCTLFAQISSGRVRRVAVQLAQRPGNDLGHWHDAVVLVDTDHLHVAGHNGLGTSLAPHVLVKHHAELGQKVRRRADLQHVAEAASFLGI